MSEIYFDYAQYRFSYDYFDFYDYFSTPKIIKIISILKIIVQTKKTTPIPQSRFSLSC